MKTVLGVDIGGTKVLTGTVVEKKITGSRRADIPYTEDPQEVIDTICDTINPQMSSKVNAIGVGVPSVVDTEQGIVYDVQNIPSWKEVHLKAILEEKYQVPVCINNDANCFALGEKYFGQGQGQRDFVALIIGTGMAAGMIINNRLYEGSTCGAGEFGTIRYLDQCYEYYAAGQFFENVHETDGKIVYDQAVKGNAEALEKFAELGGHIGEAIKLVIYTVDPPLIILGGSVSKAYRFFEQDMWNKIQEVSYRMARDRIKIICSNQPDIAVLGAAALCLDKI